MNDNRKFNFILCVDGPWAGVVLMIDRSFTWITLPSDDRPGVAVWGARLAPQRSFFRYVISAIAPDDPASLYLDAVASFESVR